MTLEQAYKLIDDLAEETCNFVMAHDALSDDEKAAALRQVEEQVKVDKQRLLDHVSGKVGARAQMTRVEMERQMLRSMAQARGATIHENVTSPDDMLDNALVSWDKWKG